MSENSNENISCGYYSFNQHRIGRPVVVFDQRTRYVGTLDEFDRNMSDKKNLKKRTYKEEKQEVEEVDSEITEE